MPVALTVLDFRTFEFFPPSASKNGRMPDIYIVVIFCGSPEYIYIAWMKAGISAKKGVL